MKHFFETVFYYCYLSYKRKNPDPEIMALDALSVITNLFIVIVIQTICIYYNINLADNSPFFYLSLFPLPLLYFIFYRMLYAKGKYKEIIEKNLNFAITLKSINGSLGDISGESPFWEFCLHPPGIP